MFLTTAGMSFAAVTIAWDPNSEKDLDGYEIYVSKGTPGPPYDHLEDVFLDELNDPDNPSVKLAEIEADGKYFLVTTAFDTQGDESEFSKGLCVKMSGSTAAICDPNGGGGGG